MRFVLVAVLCVLSFPVSVSAADLEIKGVHVDRLMDCNLNDQLETRPGTFYDACRQGRKSWFKQISFLGDKASMYIEVTSARIVKSVMVTDFDFQTALVSLEAKFGKPKLNKSIVQNRAGAQFPQLEALWTQDNVLLQLKQHGARLDEPMLMLVREEFSKSTKVKPSSDL